MQFSTTTKIGNRIKIWDLTGLLTGRSCKLTNWRLFKDPVSCFCQGRGLDFWVHQPSYAPLFVISLQFDSFIWILINLLCNLFYKITKHRHWWNALLYCTDDRSIHFVYTFACQMHGQSITNYNRYLWTISNKSSQHITFTILDVPMYTTPPYEPCARLNHCVIR